mgnify:CR=1 FL=1
MLFCSTPGVLSKGQVAVITKHKPVQAKKRPWAAAVSRAAQSLSLRGRSSGESSRDLMSVLSSAAAAAGGGTAITAGGAGMHGHKHDKASALFRAVQVSMQVDRAPCRVSLI